MSQHGTDLSPHKKLTKNAVIILCIIKLINMNGKTRMLFYEPIYKHYI